jgi:hypothetical protein
VVHCSSLTTRGCPSARPLPGQDLGLSPQAGRGDASRCAQTLIFSSSTTRRTAGRASMRSLCAV